MNDLMYLLETELNEVNDLVPYKKEVPSILKPLQVAVTNNIQEIQKIVNAEDDYISNKGANNILTILTKLSSSIADYARKVKPRPIDKKDVLDKIKRYSEATKRLIDKISNAIKTGNKIRKAIFTPILKEFYKVFSDIIDTKVGKSLLAALAYTNPVTALMYNNKDVVGL